MMFAEINSIRVLKKGKPPNEGLLSQIERDPGSVQPIKVYRDAQKRYVINSGGLHTVLQALQFFGTRNVQIDVVGEWDDDAGNPLGVDESLPAEGGPVIMDSLAGGWYNTLSTLTTSATPQPSPQFQFQNIITYGEES